MSRLSPAEIKPLILNTLTLPTPFSKDDIVKALCTHLSITEADWGYQTGYGGKSWMGYNAGRAASQLTKANKLVRVGRGKYDKPTKENLTEEFKTLHTELVNTLTAKVAAETETIVEELVEETVVEMEDNTTTFETNDDGVSFELPTPPADTECDLDDQLIDFLKKETGCFSYYSARATKCKLCPLAHHCAKELNNVMGSISKALA